MKSLRPLITDLTLVAAAVAGATILVAIGLYAAGYPAHNVLIAWIKGALGTPADFFSALNIACPLILTGLAAGIAFRSGVFNIGAEGQSFLGALAGVALATRLLPAVPSFVAIPTMLLAAALGGALWAFLAAALQRFRGVPIVLSTILLNIVAVHLVGFLLEGPLRTTNPATQVIESDTLPVAFWLPNLLTVQGGYLHAGILIAALLAAACWVIQSRTAYGFEMLITGLNPTAAQYAGIPVSSRQFGIMLWSGAFAGLAGAMQLMGVEGAHYLLPHPASVGYAGIAVALLGRLHPAGIVCAAIFFGLLDQGANNLEFSNITNNLGFSNVPLEISQVAKGIVVILLLIGAAQLARRKSLATEP